MYDLNTNRRTVVVRVEVHEVMVKHVAKSGRKIGLWAEEAILEKIARETKKIKKMDEQNQLPE